MGRRCIARCTLLAVLVVSVVIPPLDPPIAQAAPAYPITILSIDGREDLSYNEIGADGHTGLIHLPDRAFHESFVWADFRTGRTVVGLGGRDTTLTGAGRFVFWQDGSSGRQWQRLDSATGEIISIHPRLGSDWQGSIISSSADGNIVAMWLFSRASGEASGILLDVRTSEILTPLPNGLAETAGYDSPTWLSADASIVNYFEAAGFATAADRHIRWDRRAGTRRVVEAPKEKTRADWWVSVDAEWSAFVSGNKLQARRTSDGRTFDVPVDARLVKNVKVSPNGQVVFTYSTPQLVLPDNPYVGLFISRLALWRPGYTEVVELTSDEVTVFTFEDGQWPFEVSDNGQVVTFNHARVGIDPLVNRIGQINLPPSDPRPISPQRTACLTANGAEPGDMVGLNLTPVNALSGGFGIVHSSEVTPGSTSSVNFGPGSVDPNFAFTEVGGDGKICFTNSTHSTVDLVADQLLIIDPSAFEAAGPEGAVRLADTRSGLGGTRLASNSTLCVDAAGETDEFAVLNVVVVGAAASGFATVHSSDDAAGQTSNVNFGPGSVDPNMAVSRIGSDGNICVANSKHGPVDVVIDQLFIGSASAFRQPLASGAARVADTRISLGGPILAASATRCFAVVGASPGEWVGLNVTAVSATTEGFGTLHSSDQSAGPTSNVNFGPGSFDPNVAFVEVGTDGAVCFTNSRHGSVHVVVDELVVSDATVFSAPPRGASRLIDTRLTRL